MKRMLFFLALLLLPAGQVAFAFADVPNDHPNVEAIESLSILNVVKGYEQPDTPAKDWFFKPENKVNRAEMLTMVMKGAGIETNASPQTVNFLDVPEGSWFFPYVRKGQTLKIIKGYSDGTFRPAKTVTLAEALVMIFASNNIPVQINIDKQWYEPYVEKAVALNLVSRSNPLTNPMTEINRGSAAELIFRMKKISSDKLAKFDAGADWKIFRNETNYYQIKYPVDWLLFKGQNHSALWKLDTSNNQVWLGHTYPESARLTISLIDSSINLQNAKTDLNSIYGEEKIKYSNVSFGSHRGLMVEVLSRGIVDMYLNLSNGKSLAFYGEYGDSATGDFLGQELSGIVESFSFVEKPTPPPPPTPEEKLTTARQNILVEGKGQETLAKFTDKALIETDAIGVGTGPVDYYYSAEINATLKYERSANVILNIVDGKKTDF